MTAPPINLTHLRELPSNLIAGQPYATVNVPAYTLLALIDTAEAALGHYVHHTHGEIDIENTLARYTT